MPLDAIPVGLITLIALVRRLLRCSLLSTRTAHLAGKEESRKFCFAEEGCCSLVATSSHSPSILVRPRQGNEVLCRHGGRRTAGG